MLLSPDQLESIQEAVARAEAGTSGEIVSCLVERSGRYGVAIWRGVAAGGVVGLLGATLLPLSGLWNLGMLHTAEGAALAAVFGAFAAALLVKVVPAVGRLFAGRERMSRLVRLQARVTFLDEEVFRTKARTGILIFVSLFEHRIEVVGDEGINRHVVQSEWDEVVAVIRRGIRSGDVAGGLVAGIEAAGRLLERPGLERTPDDVDELPDGLRLRDSP